MKSIIQKVCLCFVLIVSHGLSSFATKAQSTQSIIRYDAIHHPVISAKGMVASQSHFASTIGADILKKGGNAVDAAVAMGFALAVTLPRAGNIGGGGFMMVHMADTGETISIDYRSLAPLSATAALFKGENGRVDRSITRYGYKASGVPGTVAGLHLAHQKYGKLNWFDVLEPAIRLAEDGIIVSYDLAGVINNQRENMLKYEGSRAAFFKNGGFSYEPGDLFKQPDLAWSLKEIQNHGADAFYKGEIAKKFADDMAKNGGLITLEDLANYKARIRKPVTVNYRGNEVNLMPPPSGGGVLIGQMLNVFSHFDIKEMGLNGSETIHLMSEAMKRAYADRSEHLGDPDFYDVPTSAWINKSYAQEIVGQLNLERATHTDNILPGKLYDYVGEFEEESKDTTHYSVIDKDGNAVSNTYTLGYSFGSGVAINGAGFLLDNQINNFAHNIGVEGAKGIQTSPGNELLPGKRMASTMTPTIVLKNGKVWFATGTPGGNRIVTAILQVLMNIMDHGLNIAEAQETPRFHQNWSDSRLKLEKGFSPDTIKILQTKGHEVLLENTMGSMQTVMWENGLFYGTADTRRPGALAVGVPE